MQRRRFNQSEPLEQRLKHWNCVRKQNCFHLVQLGRPCCGRPAKLRRLANEKVAAISRASIAKSMGGSLVTF
jgi:hypothetical protein